MSIFTQMLPQKHLFSRHYFICNLQGDVIALIDANGNIAANYGYDAWGKVTGITDADGNAITAQTHIANANPIRYRGYYYDTETGFYYLRSRYYDPEICRFINADALASTGQGLLGYNMYAYCNNNPVNCFDASGQYADALAWWSTTMWWICVADGPLPWGDIIYAGVCTFCIVAELITVNFAINYVREETTDRKAESNDKSCGTSASGDHNNNNKKSKKTVQSEAEKKRRVINQAGLTEMMWIQI